MFFRGVGYFEIYEIIENNIILNKKMGFLLTGSFFCFNALYYCLFTSLFNFTLLLPFERKNKYFHKNWEIHKYFVGKKIFMMKDVIGLNTRFGCFFIISMRYKTTVKIIEFKRYKALF